MPDVAVIAAAEIGITEEPLGSNRGPPFDRYALRGDVVGPWCARFVRWCYERAERPLPGNPYDLGNVAAMRARLDAHGALVKDPRPGDIGFVWGRGKSDAGSGNHCFIVERVEGRNVHTIEGNLGHAVVRSVRSLDDGDLWGFGRWPV